MFVEEQVVSKKKVYVAPCIRCGSEDIKLDDCGYSSFNFGGGKCNNCGHEVSVQVGSCSPKKSELAAVWNKANDKQILINEAKEKIKEQEDLIKSLGG